MRLHNYTVLYLSGAMFLVLSIWAAIFYVNMLDEIQDSIDDGLENTKLLVIRKTIEDSSILQKDNFFESNYRIREIKPHESYNFKDIYSDTTIFTENEKDFEPFRMLTTVFKGSNDKYYKLRIISSMVEEDDLIEDLLYSLIALYAVLIVSMIFVNNFLLKKIWKPFYQTIEKLRGYKISDQDEIVFEQTRVEEFKLLQKSLEDLIQTNRETFKAQKQFIENASHELQTPLAIGINKLELMAEKSDFSDEQLQKISEVIDSLERLTRLNKSLLLLSKIENRQFPETENIHMNMLVKKLAGEFEELADFKSVNIHIEENNELNISTNKSLSEILVTNLLKNAIFHNQENGKVNVILNSNSLTIENSGDAALDPDKIFGRFYKSSQQTQSTGLGLAIVQSIIDMYGFAIRYEFNGVHRFTIVF
jgi:signal transduction histidine kinase